MKTLQVGLGEILRKFSITISKSTQNLWIVSKLQSLCTMSLTLFVMINFDWWIIIWMYILMNYYMNAYVD